MTGLALTGGTVGVLAVGAFAAGLVDAVVGGGGLIQLPTLLLALPGAAPAQILATNKFGSIWGTTTSAVTYWRRVRPDLRTAVPMAVVAYLAAIGGAQIGLHIPEAAFTPVVLVLLVGVGGYTVARPRLGRHTVLRWSGVRHTLVAMGIGVVIGGYDGALGPGTGSFLVFALVGLSGYAFLQASALAKVTNAATNLGALTVFAPGGHVVWAAGAVVAAANLAGGYVGARVAVAGGNRFVRTVFLVVVAVFIVRLGGSLLGWW